MATRLVEHTASQVRTVQVTDAQATLLSALLTQHTLRFGIHEDVPLWVEELNDKFEALVLMGE